jgi:predicted RNA-binding protein YlxR (DUF448 family)
MKSHERPESRLEQSREFLIRCFRKAKKKLRKLFHRRSFGLECVCASQRRNCRALLECIRQEEASMRTNHARQSEGRGWWVFGEMSFRLGTRRNRTTFRSVEMESEVKLPPDDDEDNESFFSSPSTCCCSCSRARVRAADGGAKLSSEIFSVFILTNPRIMEISEPSSGTASSCLICFGLLLLLIDGTSEKTKKTSFGAMTMNNSIVSVSRIDFVAGQ